MNRNLTLRKIIRDLIREEIMSSAKFYLHGSPTTEFPYENNKESEDIEAQSEVMKMATDMGLEPSKGYIANTYVNEEDDK